MDFKVDIIPHLVEWLHGGGQHVDDDMLPLAEVDHTAQRHQLRTGALRRELEIHSGTQSGGGGGMCVGWAEVWH